VGFVFPRGRQRKRRSAVPFLILLAAVALGFFATNCGGGFAMPSGSKTYVITVTGTSGETQRSTTVTMIVQ
jgi:ABC-type transporter Mla subunit MlaD